MGLKTVQSINTNIHQDNKFPEPPLLLHHGKSFKMLCVSVRWIFLGVESRFGQTKLNKYNSGVEIP